MNKTIVALAVVLGLISLPATARPMDSGHRNIILVNAGDLLNGVVSIEYERGLNSFFGIEFGMSVLAFHSVFAPPLASAAIAISPEFGVRFHFIRDAPGGLWIGPSINAAYIAPISGSAVLRPFGIGFGAAVGYNFIIRHFALQLGIGGAVQDYGDGFVWSPRFRLGLGGAF